MRGIAVGLGLVLGLAAVGPAHAQTIPPSGIEFDDAELFKPTVDPGPFLSIYDSSTLPAGRYSIGASLGYAFEPFDARRRVAGEEENVEVVDNLVTMSVVGAIGLADRFQLGMHLPLYVVDDADVVLGTEPRGDTTFNFGDLLVNGKLDLLRSGGRGFGLALLPAIGFPTGNRRDFAGTGRFSYGGLLAADYAGEDVRFGVNFGGMIRDGFGGRDDDDDLEDVFRWGFALAYPVGERVTLIGEFNGVSDADEEFHSPAELIGAARWNVGPVDLTFGAGGGLNDGKNAATFRLVFGVTAARAGIAPVTAAPPAETAFAGPERLVNSRKTYVVEDWDRNGQVSGGDVIVYTITLVNTGAEPLRDLVVTDPIPPNTTYVPASLTMNGLPLSDAAGFVARPPQIVARIPELGAGATSNQVLLSFKTKIRADVGTATTLQNVARVRAAGMEEFSLPAVDTAVFPAGAQRDKVVQTAPATEGVHKLEITENIQFVPGQPAILPQSHAVLDQVASVLREEPELRVRIIGHTDSQGSDESNLALSQDRAEAVKSYLVDQGIDPGRLEAEGRGETEPIAPNATEEGRAANRRVEFVVIAGR